MDTILLCLWITMGLCLAGLIWVCILLFRDPGEKRYVDKLLVIKTRF